MTALVWSYIVLFTPFGNEESLPGATIKHRYYLKKNAFKKNTKCVSFSENEWLLCQPLICTVSYHIVGLCKKL